MAKALDKDHVDILYNYRDWSFSLSSKFIHISLYWVMHFPSSLAIRFDLLFWLEELTVHQWHYTHRFPLIFFRRWDGADATELCGDRRRRSRRTVRLLVERHQRLPAMARRNILHALRCLCPPFLRRPCESIAFTVSATFFAMLCSCRQLFEFLFEFGFSIIMSFGSRWILVFFGATKLSSFHSLVMLLVVIIIYLYSALIHIKMLYMTNFEGHR